MPLLTNENVSELASQVRTHLYGDDAYPVTVDDCRRQVARRNKSVDVSAGAWVFGPENSYVVKSSFKTLVGVGLGDGVVCGQGPDGRLLMLPKDAVADPIERQLQKLLDQHPSDQGYEITVACVTKYRGSAGGAWDQAGAEDQATAERLARSQANTDTAYDQAALIAEDQFESAHRALAVANSGPLAPAVCLECGGTVGVESGGMGCARCNK